MKQEGITVGIEDGVIIGLAKDFKLETEEDVKTEVGDNGKLSFTAEVRVTKKERRRLLCALYGTRRVINLNRYRSLFQKAKSIRKKSKYANILRFKLVRNHETRSKRSNRNPKEE